MTLTGFTERGARRVAQAVMTVEGMDPRHTGTRPAFAGTRSQAADFIVLRVTEASPANVPTRKYAAVQVHRPADGTGLRDLPNGMQFSLEVTGVPLYAALGGLAVGQFALGWLSGGIWHAIPYSNTSEWWGEITDSDEFATNRWDYEVEERVRTATGWEAPDDPRVLTAYNSLEANNSGSGVQGNGIDLDGQIFTDNSSLEIMPAPQGAIVRVYEEWYVDADGVESAYVSFQFANPVDGTCG